MNLDALIARQPGGAVQRALVWLRAHCRRNVARAWGWRRAARAYRARNNALAAALAARLTELNELRVRLDAAERERDAAWEQAGSDRADLNQALLDLAAARGARRGEGEA